MKRNSAKPYFLLLFFGLFCSLSTLQAQDNGKTYKEGPIKITGNVHNAGSRINGLKINLYKYNDQVHTIQSNWLGKFDFKLDTGKYYTVEVKHPGFVTKRIGINTTIPDGHPLPDPFDFDMEVVKKQDLSDTIYEKDIFDFPAGLVRYSPELGHFEFNQEYTYDTMLETSTLLYKSTMKEVLRRKMEEDKMYKQQQEQKNR